jgi:DNA-binding transcriptional MerR regulator/mannose-6-phosphate isomerase-like protein (cupin superfamily)
MTSEPQDSAFLQISDVARLAAVSISTIRVWEARGLIAPTYTSTGRRSYRQADVGIAVAIKRMRSVQGMKIPEIKAALVAQDRDPASPKDERPATTPASVGMLLQRLRQTRRLTIRRVASAIGVDPAILASIERTSLGLDIPILKRLAGFYEVTLNEVMGVAATPADREILTRERGVILPSLGIGVQIERLGSGQDIMDCQRWRVEPGIHSNGSYRHEGEEFLAVVAGEFEITIADSRVHLLTVGDTIYFRSNIPHSWRNPGREVAELIWTCVGDSF